jgi:hypothetical protein
VGELDRLTQVEHPTAVGPYQRGQGPTEQVIPFRELHASRQAVTTAWEADVLRRSAWLRSPKPPSWPATTAAEEAKTGWTLGIGQPLSVFGFSHLAVLERLADTSISATRIEVVAG